MKTYTKAEYDQLMDGFVTKIVLTVVGAVLGGAIGSSCGLMTMIIFGVMCAGAPYAWTKIPFIALGVWSLIIKFLIAVCLGWVITPIALAVDISRIVSYRKAVKEEDGRGGDSDAA